MKNSIITLLLSAISFCCLAQTPFTEQTLLDMNKRLMQDFTKFAFEEISPEFSFTTADGAILTHQVMKDAKIKAVEWNTHDLKIKQIGNVAIVRGINDHIMQSTTSNEISKYSVHFIYTFEYKKDKWLWLTMHHIYNNPSTAEDETAIKTMLEAETKAFHAGDITAVLSNWHLSPTTRIVGSDTGQTFYAEGEAIPKILATVKADNHSFSNDNYNIKISSAGKMAWATYDQIMRDKEGKTLSQSHEIRCLENVNGVWKIVIVSAHHYKPKTSTNQANPSIDGQTIQKGNMVGIHTITVELKPNVTLDQVLDFYNTKWAPAADKYFGWKVFFGKCLRGTEYAENKLLMIGHFKTEADRDKYFKMAEGGNDLNELGQKAWAQFAPTNDALLQLATIKEEWADWVIK